MVGEPVSAVTATTVTLTSVTFASLFSGTDAGVYVGAFAGAVVYVLSSTELTRLAQVGYFVASFLIGILAAGVSTDILNILIGKYLPGGIVIGDSIGATVSAALGVCFLISVKKIDIPTILRRLLSGGGDGNPK
ncbi:putative holin [Citrobacter freundii]|nr:hypothetical protein [Citrobacter freundii]ELJ9990411.1 hypothetical protein [Citrobacter freundii]EMD0452280.1 hypothetical protein [Citrobacter freundii]